MQKKKKEVLELIGFGSVGKSAGMAYQTVSKVAKGSKLRSVGMERMLVQGAREAANEQIENLLAAIETLNEWEKELK